MKIHELWHKFQREFMDKERNWLYRGCEFMDKAEEFAEKNPDVIIRTCDDSHHMTSDIVLVPHKDSESTDPDYKYWGTTVVIIPQNGDEPLEFFLYRGHKKLLIQALENIEK